VSGQTPHLFGDDEELFRDVADYYEALIEPFREDEDDRTPRTIEEWDTHPPRYHLPDVERVIGFLCEHVADWGEVCENGYEAFESAIDTPEIRSGVERLLDAIARNVKFGMARTKIAEHTLTWDDRGRPLVDGELLYAPREEAS
jgi:hypothetical protein